MRVGSLLAAFLVVGTPPLAAQRAHAGAGLRVGAFVGGISTAGIAVEVYEDTHAVELAIGTWSLRNLSASIVYKEYLGASRLGPFVGAGLWAAAALPADPDDRTGLALVLRAPVGIDWAFADDHALGAALNVNKGLAVRRSDPLDDLPMTGRLVPLPEAYYRFTTR